MYTIYYTCWSCIYVHLSWTSLVCSTYEEPCMLMLLNWHGSCHISSVMDSPYLLGWGLSSWHKWLYHFKAEKQSGFLFSFSFLFCFNEFVYWKWWIIPFDFCFLTNASEDLCFSFPESLDHHAPELNVQPVHDCFMHFVWVTPILLSKYQLIFPCLSLSWT